MYNYKLWIEPLINARFVQNLKLNSSKYNVKTCKQKSKKVIKRKEKYRLIMKKDLNIRP